MKKAVLISIHPKWCELIASGKKILEIRKTRPKQDTPFKVFIYETRGFERVGNENLNCVVGGNGRGAVIGEFVCDSIFPLSFYASDASFFDTVPPLPVPGTCLTDKEIAEYLGNGKTGYGWHISDLKVYDKPENLTDFVRPSGGCCNEGKCSGCQFLDKGNGYNVEDDCMADFDTDRYSIVKRPPQSWCYVENMV